MDSSRSSYFDVGYRCKDWNYYPGSVSISANSIPSEASCYLRALCGCSQRSLRFKILASPRQTQSLKSRRPLRTAAECAVKDGREQPEPASEAIVSASRRNRTFDRLSLLDLRQAFSVFFIGQIKNFAEGLTTGVYSVRWLVHLSDHLEVRFGNSGQIRL
jgi:hypothetical protein